MKGQRFGIWLLFLLHQGQFLFAQGLGWLPHGPDSAFAVASESGSDLIVVVGADWLEASGRMIQALEQDPEAGEAAAAYVTVAMDHSQLGPDNRLRQVRVLQLPEFLLFGPDGRLLARRGGTLSTAEFVQFCRFPYPAGASLPEQAAAWRPGWDLDSLADFVHLLDASGYPVELPLQEYLNRLPPEFLLTETHFRAASRLATDLQGPHYQFSLAHKDTLALLHGEAATAEYLRYGYQSAYAKALDQADAELFAACMTALPALLADSADIARLQASSQLSFDQAAGDWQAYQAHALHLMEEFLPEDPELLNDVAWLFYLHVDDAASLEKALEWARKSVEQVPQYYNLDTYGALLYKVGRYEEALDVLQKALLRGENEGLDTAETASLIRKVKEQLR